MPKRRKAYPRPLPRRKKFNPENPQLESELEKAFAQLLIQNSFPTPTIQHVFHPIRQWRFDFAWPTYKLAVEIQGFGEYHNSYEGMQNDCEKHNAAILLNWRVIYFMGINLTPDNQQKTIATLTSFFETHCPAFSLGGKRANNTTSNWSDSIIAARRQLDPKTNPR